MSIASSITPAPLRVEIKPSVYFLAALSAVTLAALAAIFAAQLTRWQTLALAVIALFYSGHCWRAHLRQRGILQWRAAWSWVDVDGVERALRLRHCTVWPGLMVLRFREIERGRVATLTLCADSFADVESARRLRVHLHHFPVFEGAD